MWRTVLVFCMCAIVMGDAAPQPGVLQSPAGREALHHYDVACVAARQAYYAGLIDADQKKIAELDKVMKSALSAADLDEANRVKAAQGAAADALKEHKQALLDVPTSFPPIQAEALHTFGIFARERWKATMKVQKGQRYRVTARGQWSGGPDANKNRITCGPEGMIMPDGDHEGDRVWYLEGRINHSYPIVLGADSEFTAQEDGILQMQMMDWWIYDDDGSVEVQIQHLPIAGP